MLPKEKRLTDTRDFKRVYQKGSFFSVGYFSVNYLPNKSSFTRIGIVINKKTAPKAVDRNKLKRQLREVVRNGYEKIPAGLDLVITIKKAGNFKLEEIEKAFNEAVEKIK